MKDSDQEAGWVVGCDGTPSCLHAAIIRAARDPIYFCTPDYVIREANAPYSEIGGYTREQAIGETVPSVAGASAFEKRRHFLDAALAGEPVALQAWVEVPGKGQRFFDVSYQPVHSSDNAVLGVAAFGRDITDLKRADEALRMYKSVISQMSDRIFIINREFLYKLTNESNARWYGHTPSELIGQHVAEFVGAHRFETEVRPTLERCFKGHTLEYDFEDTEPGGRPVIVGARLEPFRNGEGEIEGAVVTLRDVTETRRLSERLERLALADDLTGLANRRAFETWLDTRLQALAQGDVALRGFSVVFIDLDDFKIVNDTVGHGAGDRFLSGIAERLGEFGSDTVHVARIGGDEFGMVIDGDDRENARAVCARVLAMFDGHNFTTDGTTFRGGASLGLATITPELIRDATSHVGSVLQWADHACMQAKAAGGRQMVEHSAFDRITAQRRAEVHHLAVIEQALNDPALLSLQRMPVSDVETGETVMHEALLRLRMPDGSLQGPSMILATAERHGLMRSVDRWAVDAVLKRLEPEGPDLPVAFNLSSDSLGSNDFTRMLLRRLSEARGLAHKLVIEVSETSITQLNASAWKCLADLRGLGCRVALDDFGKGFASFSQLRENTFDVIKIDRVLTGRISSDPVKKAAISGIVGLADALHLPTVAEYVQDAETFAPLKALGVRYAQGHFIGRPEPWPLPIG
ncbi:putative bifunctional diguanylate cyclase/phosphodiesterase [Stappia sp.]|uniref:putative bifunctional diguanylate cyclase/phosphodiesterase n=1 Tax=Stappia sp. TaxID=1870903 RepID=UPI003C7DCE7A